MNYELPAPNPCGSCPYRRDVPSGIWDESEYAKLPAYDAETGDQPIGMFLCHQQTGRICAGWCGTHDMTQSLALRIALGLGKITPGLADQICDYRAGVPLFASGAEACAHGLARIKNPTRKTLVAIRNLQRKKRSHEPA